MVRPWLVAHIAANLAARGALSSYLLLAARIVCPEVVLLLRRLRREALLKWGELGNLTSEVVAS